MRLCTESHFYDQDYRRGSGAILVYGASICNTFPALTAPRHQDLAPAALARLLAGFSTSTNFRSTKRNASFGICFTNSSAFSNPELIAFLPTDSKLLLGPFFVQLNCACSSFFTTLAPAAILKA